MPIQSPPDRSPKLTHEFLKTLDPGGTKSGGYYVRLTGPAEGTLVHVIDTSSRHRGTGWAVYVSGPGLPAEATFYGTTTLAAVLSAVYAAAAEAAREDQAAKLRALLRVPDPPEPCRCPDDYP